ncbi:hypothetical protein [Carboxydothermus islandicus]|uniref:hypothetical protein n=1 Tax=Carboxydothermus islandicus TaxID=661089 RepID=UPI0014129321|nr:hypothetical protein [Carboxydothermus islandicus]
MPPGLSRPLKASDKTEEQSSGQRAPGELEVRGWKLEVGESAVKKLSAGADPTNPR